MYTKQLNTFATADVVVCGGGVAGTFAAIAAAESGKSVIIIEQFGSLGGSASNGLVTPLMHTHISDNPQCSYLAARMRDKLRAIGACNETGAVFDPLAIKVASEQLCAEAGVQVLYHTFIADVIKDGNKITSVVIANKSGLSKVDGKMFIDGTGDGDVCVFAGAGYTKGNPETGKCQPTSLRYIVGGVDVPALGEFTMKHREETGVTANGNYTAPNSFYASVVTKGTSVFTDLFDKAIAAGDLTPEDKAYWQVFVVPGRDDALAFNNPEFFDEVDGTDPVQLTHNQLEGKERIMRQLRFYKKYFKGFEKAYIADVAGMVGIRESRQIEAEYVLTAEDVLTHKKFDDAFAQSNYPIDVHAMVLSCKNNAQPADDGKPYYEIPYRSLVVKGIDNLFVTGRCIGSDFIAQATIRIQPTCRSSGEAAGIAAAMALDENKLPREIDGSVVRAEMVKRGAVYTKVGQ